MKPWSEVYEDLRVLWREYWNRCYARDQANRWKSPQDLRLAKAIKDLAHEIVVRDQRIRELEHQLVNQRGPKQCPHCGPSCAYKDWPINRKQP